MNVIEIIQLYEIEQWSMRRIAEKFNTNHHLIRKRLIENGITISKRRIHRVFTQAHKDNISKAHKGRVTWAKGKKMTRMCKLRNMKGHLKYDITLDWLDGFEDMEKLKYLNHSITRERDYRGFTTEIYKQFIEKFYNDKKFNDLFEKWRTTKDKWIKPSLDHIKAKCNGGTLLLDNLQFVSWLENRAKVDIDQGEWESIKTRINEYF